jgi:3-isopropylmalate/(R)-2-methylmalate dehydratase small subunit
VQVTENFLQKIFDAVSKNPKTEVEVNLEKQMINIISTNEKESFEINNYKKTCLLNGYDDIDYLLSIKTDIEQFELQQN